MHMSFGAALASFNAYAVLSFFPSFLIRSHGMNVQEIGMYLGLIIGISSAIGFVGGGYLADKVGRIHKKYSLWIISASAMFAWLFVFPMYLLDNTSWVLILFFIASVPTNVYLAVNFLMNNFCQFLKHLNLPIFVSVFVHPVEIVFDVPARQIIMKRDPGTHYKTN